MDAVASSFRDMDVEYEWCVKKAVIYSDQKTIREQSFCLLFLLFRKSKAADKAKHQVNKNQTDRTSADELISKQKLTIKQHDQKSPYHQSK